MPKARKVETKADEFLSESADYLSYLPSDQEPRNYKSIGVRFNKYESDNLKKIAKANNLSLSMAIRKAINNFI